MDYVKPLHSREEVDTAGRVLIGNMDDLSEWMDAHAIVDNWRAAHQYPLNALSVVLKVRARRISDNALVFQRVKRMPSIVYKLQKRHWITLSKMQDLGGCRAVLNSVDAAYSLREEYFTRPNSHKFIRETDYIEKPKKDGYRGVHLIYSYRGIGSAAAPYAEREMLIEIQIRSRLQHYWATAVETAETFTREIIKSRPKENGLSGWEEFFALVSSCFARIEEQPAVPGTPESLRETVLRLREMDRVAHFTNMLEAFKLTAADIPHKSKAKYFLLELNPEARRLTVRGFPSRAAREANQELIESEQASLFKDEAAQQVLVSVDGIAQLKRAYPNYYLDTTQFVRRVRRIMAQRV